MSRCGKCYSRVLVIRSTSIIRDSTFCSFHARDLERLEQHSRNREGKATFFLIPSVDRSDFFFFFYINNRVFNAWKRDPLSMPRASNSFFFSFPFIAKL